MGFVNSALSKNAQQTVRTDTATLATTRSAHPAGRSSDSGSQWRARTAVPCPPSIPDQVAERFHSRDGLGVEDVEQIEHRLNTLAIADRESFLQPELSAKNGDPGLRWDQHVKRTQGGYCLDRDAASRAA